MKKVKFLSAILAAALLLSGCESIESKLETADSYMSDENYNKAIKKYEEVLKDDPENVDAYLGLTKAYEETEDYEKAFEILEEGIEKTDDKSLKKRQERVVNEYTSSTNELATTLRTQIVTFLTNADNLQKVVLNGPADCTMYTITVSDGKWTMGATTPPTFGDGSKVTWDAKTPADPSTSFIDYMTESEELRDLKNAYIEMFLENGVCTAVAVRQGTLTIATGITVEDWKAYKTAAFPFLRGIDANGQIIGTNPQLDKAD